MAARDRLMMDGGVRARFDADKHDRAALRALFTTRALLPMVAAAFAAASLPKTAVAARTKAPAAGLRIQPGIYLSDSVALSLQPGGSFLVQELGGTRRASGRYAAAPGRLTFSTGEGDVGKTRFPLTCRLAGAFNGFAVPPGQAACKPFSGLSFRTAN